MSYLYCQNTDCGEYLGSLGGESRPHCGWTEPVSEAQQPAPVQDPRNHVGNSSFESWYADYNPSGKGDKQRARDAYAAGMGDPVYLPAHAVQAPVQREAVSVFGVKSNGEVVDTGVKAPMPPRMKAKELVRETFGTWVDDDGSEADFCFAVCEQFFEWLIAQGWTAQQPAPVQEPVTKITLNDGKYLQLSEMPGWSRKVWCLHQQSGAFTRILDTFETGFVEAALRSAQQPRKAESKEETSLRAVKLSDYELVAHYCAIADGKEWAIGGLSDAVTFARAIEQAVLKKNGVST